MLSGMEVNALVDPKGLVRDVERVLLSSSKPPARVAVEHRGSWLGVMPAAGEGYYAVKIVGVFPEAPRLGLPLVRGTLFLIDPVRGDILLEADAAPATAWRTAAATTLALKTLGYRNGVLGIVGAGVQGEHHARVIGEVLGFTELLVNDQIAAKAESLASKLGGRVASLREIHERADAIVAATTSQEPVVRGEALKPGAVVGSVGAPKPVRELDDSVVRRSRCLLVDTEEGVRGESEEWKSALAILELSRALKGEGCDWGDVKVYKSVGYALFDLAIALHLYERLKSSQPYVM
ncbi:MAG: ornithine cyclodeaminase family protein [Acidilobaceae archaeon]